MIFVILAIVIAAAYMDIKTGRIPNKLNFAFVAGGFLYSCMTRGGYGAISSIKGVGISILALMVLFATGVLGAGDIKLFAGIGAFLGTNVILVIIYSFLICGIYGAVLILGRLIIQGKNGALKSRLFEIINSGFKVTNVTLTKVAFSVFIAFGLLVYVAKGGYMFGV